MAEAFGSAGNLRYLQKIAEPLHGAHKSVVGDGFGQISVAAELEAAIDLGRVVGSGEHVDGDGARCGVGLDSTEHFHAVNAGHADIEHDQRAASGGEQGGRAETVEKLLAVA